MRAVEHVQTLLALAAAAQLAHAGHQQIGRGHGLAVVVRAHIERLDLLGIVGHEHRLAKDLLGQVALVLGLQIATPIGLVLKLMAAFLKDFHGLGVAHAAKVGVAHGGQAVDQALLDKAVQELHLFGRFSQHRVDDVLDHILLKIHVLLERREGDFRLDHPEFGGVALRIAALSAEGRAEGVHLVEGQRQRLGVQLAGHGERNGLAEEILAVIDLPVLSFRQRCSDRAWSRWNISPAPSQSLPVISGVLTYTKPLIVEEAMHGLRGDRADAVTRTGTDSRADADAAMVRIYSSVWRFFCSG